MKKRYKIPVILLCTAGIAAAGAYYFVPWRDVAARHLAGILESRGFENVRLTIEDAGLRGAHLRDITIGADDPLTLRDLSLQYEWREILDGKLRDLVLADLELTLRQGDEGWALQGFRKSPGAAAFTLPVTAATMRAIMPLDKVTLTDARLSVVAPAWNATIPAAVAWDRAAGHKMTADARDVAYTRGPVAVTIGTARADAHMDEATGTWPGTWSAADIVVKNLPAVPALAGAGTITAHADHINIEGQVAGDEGKTAITFAAAEYFTAPEKSIITIKEAATAWGNGTLTIRGVTIPVAGNAPIRFDLIVDKVGLDAQISKITGNRVTAAATASGTIPMLYNPGGAGMPTLATAKDAPPTIFAPSWKDGTATMTITADNATYKQDAVTATVAAANATLKLDPVRGQWTGTWTARDIAIKDNKTLPVLDGTGSVMVLPDRARIDGTLSDRARQTSVKFTATQHFTVPAQNRLTLTEAAMPWKNGILRVRNVAIPVGRKAPVNFDLLVENVSLDELMQAITGKRVNATGAVSGTLPLIYNPDGSIMPGKGLLDADTPGTITMPPDAIPGDNAQIVLTREILSNFQYEMLSITTELDADGKPVILLALQGKNPEVQKGRAVKLNVRLTGDVLDFVRQNVILLTSPEKLIQQDTP